MATKPNRKWRRAGAAGLAAAALILLELALRVLGIAEPGRPWSEIFSRPGRVFVREGEIYRTGEKARAYFLTQEFPANKAAGTIRILIAGGSAAMGFPLESVFGPKQLLDLALPAVAPGRSYEVINAAGFGLASYRELEVVQEGLDYDLDAVIVLTGNNEFLRRRLPAEEGGGAAKLEAALSRLRIYRVMAGAEAALRRGGEANPFDWEPHPVSARERKQVREDYERNLEKIGRLCDQRGVKLILVTSPVNLRDFRPYGPSQVPQEEMEKIDREVDRDPDSALNLIKDQEKNFPDEAWLRYESAWAFWIKADRVHALQRWTEAGDLDPWPVRAASEINQAVRIAAQDTHAELADAERRFAEVAAPEGLPGNGLFFDHCHPNLFGQRLLARIFIEALGRVKVIKLLPDWETQLGVWDQYQGQVEKPAWAECYYRIAFETGINMKRPRRGLVYLRHALELEPGHEKAARLLPRLETEAEGRYVLRGE